MQQKMTSASTDSDSAREDSDLSCDDETQCGFDMFMKILTNHETQTQDHKELQDRHHELATNVDNQNRNYDSNNEQISSKTKETKVNSTGNSNSTSMTKSLGSSCNSNSKSSNDIINDESNLFTCYITDQMYKSRQCSFLKNHDTFRGRLTCTGHCGNTIAQAVSLIESGKKYNCQFNVFCNLRKYYAIDETVFENIGHSGDLFWDNCVENQFWRDILSYFIQLNKVDCLIDLIYFILIIFNCKHVDDNNNKQQRLSIQWQFDQHIDYFVGKKQENQHKKQEKEKDKENEDKEKAKEEKKTHI